MKDVDFTDDQNGWAMTVVQAAIFEPALLRTRDGGRTWSPLPFPCPDHNAWLIGMLSFVDSATGWIMCVGDPGAGQQSKQLWQTVDGGDHWILLRTADMGKMNGNDGGLQVIGYATDLFFLDAKHGWMTETLGGLFQTSDGGRSWQHILVTEIGENAIMCNLFWVSPSEGMVVYTVEGECSGIVHTSDGGASWTVLTH